MTEFYDVYFSGTTLGANLAEKLEQAGGGGMVVVAVCALEHFQCAGR